MLDGENKSTKSVRNSRGNVSIRRGDSPWQSRCSLQPVEDLHCSRGKEREERSFVNEGVGCNLR